MNAIAAYEWAWRLLLLSLLCALIGAAIFLSRWGANPLILLSLFIGLLAMGGSVMSVLVAISEDPSLTPDQVKKMRGKVLFFGPLGALEILLSRRMK